MGALILLASLCDVRQLPVVETRTDVIELNHFFDENGKLVFDQVIAWDWCNCAERFQVRAWRLWRPSKPVAASERKGVIIFVDGETLRRVRYGSRRESWTQYDPELFDRQILPSEERRDFGKH